MSSSPQPTRNSTPLARFSRFVGRCLMLLAMFAIVYVLAIGPLYWQWYAEAHMGEPGWLLLLYAPLETACENSELVNDWVDSYIELWVT